MAEAIGAPEPTLVHIPTDLLGKIAPRHAQISTENLQFDNIFDNTAARTDLDYHFRIQWREGVQRTVAWLDAHLQLSGSEESIDDQVIAVWHQLEAEMIQRLAGLES